jgi:hypothetical protein
MTSAVAPHATSLGWINRAFLEAGKTGTQFDNYGGEDRFWLGPEAGQFGVFFPPGAPYTLAFSKTPAGVNEGAWTVARASETSVVLTRAFQVTNHSSTVFDVAVERTVTVLSRGETASRLGVALTPSVQAVAFETQSQITNAGREAWTKERGLLSVWILGMFAASPGARIVMPFAPGPGEIVNDRYFGKVPPERLSVHEREGFLAFTCDGGLRSKIGLGPRRARSPLASYSAEAGLLTLVQFDRPANATEYVNSMWEEQADPYDGDVVNGYNDGPTGPESPSLDFYELETSSPAASLAPGASLAHTHCTIHFEGEPADLEPIARSALGIGLEDFTR